MAEVNGSATNGKAVTRSPRGQFLKGVPGVGGRKRGSRNLLSERFLADLHSQWVKSGKTVLQTVAQQEPATFLKVIAGVMPKVLDIDAAVSMSVHSELAVEVRDFAEAYKRWGEFIGVKSPPLIEAEATENEDLIEAEDGQSPNGE
jgi:hypothetical protein